MDEPTRDPSVGPPVESDPAGWRADGQREHATLRRVTEHGVAPYDAEGDHASVERVRPSVNGSHRRGSGERPTAAR
jgi:hypothetical protein